MKKFWACFITFCLVPVALFGAVFNNEVPSARLNKLIAEKQAKMEKLKKCKGTTKNLKIAGISTLGITAVGVGANIAEAVILKDEQGKLETEKANLKTAQEKQEQLLAKQAKSTSVKGKKETASNENADELGTVNEEEAKKQLEEAANSGDSKQKQQDACGKLGGQQSGNTCTYTETISVSDKQTVDSTVVELLKNKDLITDKKEVRRQSVGLYLVTIKDSKIPMQVSFENISCENGASPEGQCKAATSESEGGAVDKEVMKEINKLFNDTLENDGIKCDTIAEAMEKLINKELNKSDITVECEMDEDSATGMLTCQVGERKLKRELTACKQPKQGAGKKGVTIPADAEDKIKELKDKVKDITDFKCDEVADKIADEFKKIFEDVEVDVSCVADSAKPEVGCFYGDIGNNNHKSQVLTYNSCTIGSKEQQAINSLRDAVEKKAIDCSEIVGDARDAFELINKRWQIDCGIAFDSATKAVTCSINGVHKYKLKYLQCTTN